MKVEQYIVNRGYSATKKVRCDDGAVTKLIFRSNTLLTLQQAIKNNQQVITVFPIHLFCCLGASLVCVKRKVHTIY